MNILTQTRSRLAHLQVPRLAVAPQTSLRLKVMAASSLTPLLFSLGLHDPAAFETLCYAVLGLSTLLAYPRISAPLAFTALVATTQLAPGLASQLIAGYALSMALVTALISRRPQA